MTLVKTIFPAILAVLAMGASAATTRTTTRPWEGVSYTHETRSDPPLHLHWVRIDLAGGAAVVVRPAGADPDGAGPWQTTLLPVRAIARRDQLDIAVNGDFVIPKGQVEVGGKSVGYFLGNWARVCGSAVSEGQTWSVRPGEPSLLVDKAGHLAMGMFDAPPAGTMQMISGSAQLVLHGRVNVGPGGERAPRTAVGFDEKGRVLYLLVIDGRRPEYSVGATLAETADEMIKLGCVEALNLDGGGSSTFIMRNPAGKDFDLLNRPSDGHDVPIHPLSVERPVASALGIVIKRPSTRPATQTAGD